MNQNLATESHFSGGSDDVILQLRESNRDHPEIVAGLVLSHARAATKNNLMMVLLEHIRTEASQGAVDMHFAPLLRDLASLDNKACAKVALKAREVLISCQMPSLSERQAQMEQILKAATSSSHYGETRAGGREPDAEVLRELIDSRYTTYDVLPAFFNHSDSWISLAALESYVRRAYRAYNITNIEYIEADALDNEPLCLHWSFKMARTSTPAAMTPRGEAAPGLGAHARVGSFSDLTYILNSSQEEKLRHGIMFSTDSLQELERTLPGALNSLPDSGRKSLSSSQAAGSEPRNVVNAVVRLLEKSQDKTNENWLTTFTALANDLGSELSKRSVGRISFIICRTGQYPSYFTLRHQDDGSWAEIGAIRDIEPALAYQLELGRLENFNLTPCGVENHQIHVYYATAKENSADARFFVRALVRPGRLRGGVSVAEYLVSETE